MCLQYSECCIISTNSYSFCWVLVLPVKVIGEVGREMGCLSTPSLLAYA